MEYTPSTIGAGLTKLLQLMAPPNSGGLLEVLSAPPAQLQT